MVNYIGKYSPVPWSNIWVMLNIGTGKTHKSVLQIESDESWTPSRKVDGNGCQ